MKFFVVWRVDEVLFGSSSFLVSQFTLHAVFKGTKPDFHLAMPSEKSKAFCMIMISISTPYKDSFKMTPSLHF